MKEGCHAFNIRVRLDRRTTHRWERVAREGSQVEDDAILEEELRDACRVVPAQQPNDVKDQDDEVEAHRCK